MTINLEEGQKFLGIIPPGRSLGIVLGRDDAMESVFVTVERPANEQPRRIAFSCLQQGTWGVLLYVQEH